MARPLFGRVGFGTLGMEGIEDNVILNFGSHSVTDGTYENISPAIGYSTEYIGQHVQLIRDKDTFW